MADKKLNELGTTANFDNAYVELSQNQYRISKTNLGKQLTKEVHLNFSVASDTPAYIFAQKSDGTNFRISKRDLANAIKSDLGISGGGGSSSVDTDALYDGCYIMFHDSIDNVPCAVSYNNWASLYSHEEEADGVLIVEGGHSVLVAPHEKICYWSSKTGTAANEVEDSNENRIALLDTWNGKELTKKICTDKLNSPFYAESQTSTYAPGYCYNYTPHIQNEDGDIANGLMKNDYWLPCIAELMMIYTHKHKINAGLNLIPGAKQLSSDEYWSSTENDYQFVWSLNMSSGILSTSSEKLNKYNLARPVSAFIESY